MTDSRVGKRIELHPATDRWMRGDRFGLILSVSKRVYAYADPKDPRNGRVFTVQMDRSGQRVRVHEGNVNRVF